MGVDWERWRTRRRSSHSWGHRVRRQPENTRDMPRSYVPLPLIAIVLILVLAGCSAPLPWPDSPLHDLPATDPNWRPPESLQEAMEAIQGRYAHYDVVSYEEETEQTTLRTMVVSYGYTEFRIVDGKLYEIDTFCRAEQKLNQKGVTSLFRDAAVQAIEPRETEVELTFRDGQWHIYRPPTPTLLGINGDPALPLPMDPNDPNLTDPDDDGHPGVTVELDIGGFMKAELYITRREIYEYYLTLNSDGNLYGRVVDSSEQFVVGATMRTLRQQSNPDQIGDPGMNPIMLIRVDDSLDTCEELAAVRDDLFPATPDFQ